MMKINVSKRPKKTFMIMCSMLYITVLLASVPLADKDMLFGPLEISAAYIIFPMTFVVADIIAEVYGYQVARQVIWCGIFCDIIFAIVQMAGVHWPASPLWSGQKDYEIVLQSSLGVVLAAVIGILAGEFINVYVLSKWKVLLKGRYFWVRSIGSSFVGQTLTVVIASTVAFVFYIQTQGYMLYIFERLIFLWGYSLVMVWPASVIVKLLKMIDGEHHDGVIDFNPFKFLTND